ncbi:MAG TPA: hypothetical protein DCQ31_07435 [Bacteroidales bacterium]|nr:hypothetical protein [Bacteroidales bacterium]
MLDIRIPIGLLFAILGVILTVFGIITASDTEMYAKSLSVNVNLYMGIIMLAFGGVMLLFTFKKKNKLK